eukprot:CAMPEP_0174832030 /NCGR_PEP_ID=MMETSP1114-20130205/3448_1 /TAXON_ID=312471 /ORGANISM="Neobodo designis, Strain CCAP 1951/1" /LENGTH=335 /DNA_ID=CAMNT_0016065881 /DNA_START=38 /DNA_END=1041 /DNA_ORIENTATION=+
MSDDEPVNDALVFLKPHVSENPAVEALVRKKLQARGIRIHGEGIVDGAAINRDGLIDRHYAAIARYAVSTDPATATIPESGLRVFEERFGVPWAAAVVEGRVLNAAAAAARFDVPLAAVSAAWDAVDERAAKLMPGFAVKRISLKDDGSSCFVVNGFYVANRSLYVAPGAKVRWWTVSWREGDLSWRSFRADVIGATDPRVAAAGSIRRAILDDWEGLGLAKAPDMAQNGVHASAGPLEGVAERRIWANARADAPADDPVVTRWTEGESAVLTKAALEKALGNPTIDGIPLFDLLEDLQTSDAKDKLRQLASSTRLAVVTTLHQLFFPAVQLQAH